MLQDSTPGFEETWKFLERRMEEGNQLQKVLAISDEKTKNMTKALGSAFLTVISLILKLLFRLKYNQCFLFKGTKYFGT